MKGTDNPAQATDSLANPGQTLRDARERQGLSLSAAARQLNLSERRLTDLEDGNFSALPGHTFTRGYIRSYARLLGLDPQALVVEFDRFSGTDATGSQVHSLGRIEEPVKLSSIGLRVVSFVVLLALAGIAFFLWQDRGGLEGLSEATAQFGRIEVEGADGTTQVHTFDEPEDLAVLDNQPEQVDPLALSTDGTEANLVDAQPSTVLALPEPPAGLTTPAPLLPTEPEASGATQASPAAVDQPPVATKPPAVAATSPAQAAVAETGVAAAPATDTQPLVAATSAADSGEATLALQYSAECWTRVTDAQGDVLINGLVPAGATRMVQGTPPLSVLLGYSRGVDVTFNGEAVDISAYRRGETARFKLGQ